MSEKKQNLTCEFAVELVSYLYGEMTVGEKTVFEQHLDSCLPCAAEFAEFSAARSAVQEWHQTDFLPLAPPLIQIPREQKIVEIKKETEYVSWATSLRSFINLSAGWSAAAAALGALLICAGLSLTLFISLPEDQEIMVHTKELNQKISPSPAETAQPPSERVTSVLPDAETERNLSKPPQKNKEPLIAAEPTKSSVSKFPGNQINKKPNQVAKKAPVKKPLPKIPALLAEDDEEDGLRLSDLLEGIGRVD